MCVSLLESGRFGILEDSFFLYSLFYLKNSLNMIADSLIITANRA